jgi:hypothetical protein
MIPLFSEVFKAPWIFCQALPVPQCRQLGKVNELFQVEMLEAVNEDKKQ